MFFSRLRKKKRVLTEAEIKWNVLWDKYADGSLERDYYILCDYHAGVNGGGHHCFFDNKGADMPEYVKSLKLLLPDEFFEQINRAYAAYAGNGGTEEACGSADDYFYENEHIITDILQAYANGLSV